VKVAYTPGDPGVIELKLTKVVEPRPFRETDRVKLVEIVSPSLSKFYGREVKARAGVLLPEGWSDDPARHYPTIYVVTGFGGDHHSVRFIERQVQGEAAKEVLFVVPDPLCHFGHSVFADSENNGPRGKALVDELIPEIEKRYHGAPSPKRRFVTGVSSGGWGSLWLQVTYPDFFGGCWSHCPDPVDFRDFQQINLYAPDANMYTDDKSQRRPLARAQGGVTLWYDDFVKREWVLGAGGQIQSFEGVFSRRGKNGQPEQVFDRATGTVDTRVAKTWEKYDIRLVLSRNWATLGPKLAGKLHIYAGEMDTFYLEGAAKLLKDELERLGADAECEIIPGMAHTLYPAGWDSMMKAALGSARD
jgi:S-formylglutathione hydrolase FrmB